MKPNWNHWKNLAKATGPFPINPAMHKKKATEKSGWQEMAEKAKKQLRAAGKERGLIFKIAFRGQYAFYNKKTGARVGKIATLKQHNDYLQLGKYYIDQ